jgi:hypothetical protein
MAVAGTIVEPLAAPKPQPVEPGPPENVADTLWDKRVHRNSGPRSDQNLVCLTVCCAAPFVICPVHCLAAWGCASCVDCLTRVPGACKNVPCCFCPCSPNSKNPLWCCAEPLGWAASFGQLHTVMALVANGAKPHTKNMAGENAFTDARREKHQHVVDWLTKWDAAGRPAPGTNRMVRDADAAERRNAGFTANDAEGCYVGACIVPILITSFWVQATAPDEMTATGVTLIFPWSYTLKRAAGAGSSRFELRAKDQDQNWDWHPSGCCFWGSPGWWAIKVVPSCRQCCCAKFE